MCIVTRARGGRCRYTLYNARLRFMRSAIYFIGARRDKSRMRSKFLPDETDLSTRAQWTGGVGGRT